MGRIKIKESDLPYGRSYRPGASSPFVLDNPPKGLSQAEMPLGILRYEDALNLGATKKGVKNNFRTAERLANDQAVKEFLNKHGYTAEADIARLPGHKQLLIDAKRIKDSKKRRKIIAAITAAIGLSAGAAYLLKKKS